MRVRWRITIWDFFDSLSSIIITDQESGDGGDEAGGKEQKEAGSPPLGTKTSYTPAHPQNTHSGPSSLPHPSGVSASPTSSANANARQDPQHQSPHQHQASTRRRGRRCAATSGLVPLGERNLCRGHTAQRLPWIHIELHHLSTTVIYSEAVDDSRSPDSTSDSGE